MNLEGIFKAPKQCEFREEGRWIYLKVRGGELKYPRPDNFINVGKEKFEKGEMIGAAYNTTSPMKFYVENIEYFLYDKFIKLLEDKIFIN